MTPLPDDLDRILHDLRGPLNALMMHLEVLARANPGESARTGLETMRAEVSRLATLLPAAFDILALERNDVAAVNLGAVVRRALDDGRLGAVTLADGVWPDVRADARLLALAVDHLVQNALAATKAAGASRPPHLSAAVGEPGRVTLVVRDWGTGLRSTNPRVLIRLSTSKSGRPSAGLLIVERIVRLHGGTLQFHAPADGGAEIRLTLPAA